MPFTQVGSGPPRCLCLAWMEDQLGLGGRYRGDGYLTASQAFASWTALGFRADTPAAGDLVFWLRASDGSDTGHVGQLTDPSNFSSLWCDGTVMNGPVAEFGQPVAGYISTAAVLAGSPQAITAPSPALMPAISTPLGAPSSLLPIAFAGFGLLVALNALR
jgi:hypothetical protein